MPKKHSRSKNSMTRAMVLLAILVFAMWFYHYATSGKLQQILEVLVNPRTTETNAAKQFTEQEQNDLRKQASGFWQYVSRNNEEKSSVSLIDHIEQKDNGIIWRVRSYTLSLPDGGSRSFTHVTQAYLIPYGWKDSIKEVFVSDCPIILQAQYTSEDTCYRKNTLERLWEVAVSDSTLTVDGRRYTPYMGGIYEFFPEGALGLVDDITVDICENSYDFVSYSVSALKKYYQNSARQPLDSVTVHHVITAEYLPIYTETLSLPRVHWGKDVRVELAISPKGAVQKVTVKKPRKNEHQVHQYIESLLKSWQFPYNENTEKTVRVTAEFSF